MTSGRRIVSDLDDFRKQFLPRQAQAEEAFVLGDTEPRMELWSRRDPVSLLGALGMFQTGWEALSETFAGWLRRSRT
jgi:hypothetical protein